MIKAKIKQGSTTLATVEDTDDERGIEALSEYFDMFIEYKDKLKIIIDWSSE